MPERTRPLWDRNRLRDPLILVSAALVLAFLPHVRHSPAWVTAAFALCAAYPAASALLRWPMPPRWMRMGLILVLCAGLIFSFGRVSGRDPGVAFLALMLGVKALESRTERDRMIAVIVAFFLLATNVLYSQSIPMALYILGALMTGTAILVRLQVPAVPPSRCLKLAAIMYLQAAPLALAIFVVFPRLPGSLWGLPQDSSFGLSGLSDTLAPGDITALALSRDIAFRVQFNTAPPPPQKFYWRGPVLWEFDGREWTRGIDPPPLRAAIQGRDETDYTLTLEPYGEKWLVALDLPFTRPSRGMLLADFTSERSRPVRDVIRYDARSYTVYNTGPIAKWERIRGLRYPRGSNPRAEAMARRWAEETPDPKAIVQRGLRFFREQPFYYTLEPPPLGQEPVDDFLFSTRSGYCEHFASAFAFLMRAAGIPSRIVVGYLGGEFNPLGGYYIVRQADAHAWVEVWLEGEGWVRADPTRYVAPNRVDQGIGTRLSESENPFLPGPALGFVRKLWRRAALGLDTLNNFWVQWVIDYTPHRQRDFLSRLGLSKLTWKGVSTGLMLAVGLTVAWMLLFTFLVLRGASRRPMDPAQAVYLDFCRKLARMGLPRRPGQGPEAYRQAIREQRPDLAASVDPIFDLYIRLRYRPAPGPGALEQLRHRVRAFPAEAKGLRPGA